MLKRFTFNFVRLCIQVFSIVQQMTRKLRFLAKRPMSSINKDFWNTWGNLGKPDIKIPYKIDNSLSDFEC